MPGLAPFLQFFPPTLLNIWVAHQKIWIFHLHRIFNGFISVFEICQQNLK